METLNYVCTHLERVDELLAMLVLLFIILVIELALLVRSSRRHAEVAFQLLELKKKKNKQLKLTDLGADQSPSASEYLTEAADRKNKVKYQVGNGTSGAQTQSN